MSWLSRLFSSNVTSETQTDSDKLKLEIRVFIDSLSSTWLKLNDSKLSSYVPKIKRLIKQAKKTGLSKEIITSLNNILENIQEAEAEYQRGNIVKADKAIKQVRLSLDFLKSTL